MKRLPGYAVSQEFPRHRPGRLQAVLLTLGLLGSWLILSALLLLLSGCSQMAATLTGSRDSQSLYEQEETYRQRYLQTSSADALRWLVINRLKNGMTKAEVDQVLGESGEREFNDTKFLKQAGGSYRTDDLVYRWGPDREGNAYLFVFRDGRLVDIERYTDELKKMGGTSVSVGLSSDDF